VCAAKRSEPPLVGQPAPAPPPPRAHIIGSQWVQTPRHGDPITCCHASCMRPSSGTAASSQLRQPPSSRSPRSATRAAASPALHGWHAGLRVRGHPHNRSPPVPPGLARGRRRRRISYSIHLRLEAQPSAGRPQVVRECPCLAAPHTLLSRSGCKPLGTATQSEPACVAPRLNCVACTDAAYRIPSPQTERAATQSTTARNGSRAPGRAPLARGAAAPPCSAAAPPQHLWRAPHALLPGNGCNTGKSQSDRRQQARRHPPSERLLDARGCSRSAASLDRARRSVSDAAPYSSRRTAATNAGHAAASARHRRQHGRSASRARRAVAKRRQMDTRTLKGNGQQVHRPAACHPWGQRAIRRLCEQLLHCRSHRCLLLFILPPPPLLLLLLLLLAPPPPPPSSSQSSRHRATTYDTRWPCQLRTQPMPDASLEAQGLWID
jgi:hypothetical protein